MILLGEGAGGVGGRFHNVCGDRPTKKKKKPSKHAPITN
jgi:hypothetical protein